MNLNLYDFLFENEVLFYGMFIGMGCHLSYMFAKQAYLHYFYVDKEVQTDAWEDYSNRPSQIIGDNLTSLDTVSPRISPTEYINQTLTQSTSEVGTQAIIDSGTNVSTVTTVLPIPPVNLEVVPNPDITIVINNLNYFYDNIDKAHALADMLGLGFM